MSEQKTFGRWIKKLRAEQDLTQEMLSELVGCATPTLRALELGTRRPSRDMAERIAEVLNVPADQREEFIRLARLPLESKLTEASEPAADLRHPSFTPLPHVANSLIGREAERNALHSLLLDEHYRLVTIVGAGGMGKTRLALDLAATARTAFADGVTFVALAALQNGQNLPFSLAEALGISLQGVMDAREHVLNHLSTRTLLLVLDNFEHLLSEPDAIHSLKEILQRAPGVQLLVTSRERLRISSERTFELGGLSLPTTFHSAEPTDALILFLARAQHADSTFVLDASNRAAVTDICQLLGGMPLGIELAAAWVRTLSCEEIAAEIARNIDFLELSDRDASPRHRSMRAVFDHSWLLLNESEQRVLMALAYFREGCTRQAGEQVAGATLPLLASLLDKSLVTRSDGGRFVLHELIRQFAAEQLQQDGVHAAQIAASHAHYFTEFLESNRLRLQSDQQPQVIGEIAVEIENLRLAWDCICTQAAITCIAPYPTVLGYYFEVRGRHVEGDAMLGQWLKINRTMDLAQATDEQFAHLALIYSAMGNATARNLKQSQALVDHQQALALARRSGDSLALFYATVWAGIAYSTKGERPQGIALLTESVEHGQASGRPWCQAVANVALGFAHLLSQDPAPAYQHLQHADAQLRLLGDPHLLAICAAQLSIAANALGKSHDARHLMEENLHTSRQRGDRETTAMWLLRLGQVNKAEGNLAEAEQQLSEAIDLFGVGGEAWAASEALLNLAETLVLQGKIRQAEQHYHLTITTALARQTVTYWIEAQLGLAALWLSEGKIGEAETLLTQVASDSQPTPKQLARLQELRNKRMAT